MDASIKAYLSVLRKMPVLLDVALEVALEDLNHIAGDSGLIERLSANIISVGQAAHARSGVRQLQAALKTHHLAVVHRHSYFHRRYVRRLSLPYQTQIHSGARAEAVEPCVVALQHGFRPDICIVLDESLAVMCGKELVSLQASVLSLGQEGRRHSLRSPCTLASLSQGLAFAIAPAWPRTLQPGLAAYIGHLYGDVMCATLQEITQTVDGGPLKNSSENGSKSTLDAVIRL